MPAIRVLLIAEAANPEWSSVPLIGWSLASALAKVVDVHIVTQIRNRDALIRAGLKENIDFTAIDSEFLEGPLWKLAKWLRGGQGVGWTTQTAISSLAYPYFEYLVWRRFGSRIIAGEFDVVHRITPLTPTAPSPLSKWCTKVNVPFVIGPLNGGVPWPSGFDKERRKEREWLSYIRAIYRMVPGIRNTYRYASKVFVGSCFTMRDLPAAYKENYVYMPENGIDPNRFWRKTVRREDGPLKAAFVGRLVPYKGVDMLLEASLLLLKTGRMTIDIIGDGPMMQELQAFVRTNGVQDQVIFHRWVPNEEVQNVLSECEILSFPSIREFGGGVVLEAMAIGVVPVVVDYAGPGELVSEETGYKIPIGTREQIVGGFRELLVHLECSRYELHEKSDNARVRVEQEFIWSAKAQKIATTYLELSRRNLASEPDSIV